MNDGVTVSVSARYFSPEEKGRDLFCIEDRRLSGIIFLLFDCKFSSPLNMFSTNFTVVTIIDKGYKTDIL